jgi:hypothetical protein
MNTKAEKRRRWLRSTTPTDRATGRISRSRQIDQHQNGEEEEVAQIHGEEEKGVAHIRGAMGSADGEAEVNAMNGGKEGGNPSKFVPSRGSQHQSTHAYERASGEPGPRETLDSSVLLEPG